MRLQLSEHYKKEKMVTKFQDFREENTKTCLKRAAHLVYELNQLIFTFVLLFEIFFRALFKARS